MGPFSEEVSAAVMLIRQKWLLAAIFPSIIVNDVVVGLITTALCYYYDVVVVDAHLRL